MTSPGRIAASVRGAVAMDDLARRTRKVIVARPIWGCGRTSMPLAGTEFSGSEVIEEDERAYACAVEMGERAPHREVTDIRRPRHHHKIDGMNSSGIAVRRMSRPEKKLNIDILRRRRPSPPSQRTTIILSFRLRSAEQITGRRAVPFRSACRRRRSRIFSTRASASGAAAPRSDA